jgi:hypothetical protein
VFAVLRVAVVAIAIVLAIAVLAWALTGDPRWRRFAWTVFKYAAYGLAAILLLFAAQALLE